MAWQPILTETGNPAMCGICKNIHTQSTPTMQKVFVIGSGIKRLISVNSSTSEVLSTCSWGKLQATFLPPIRI